MHLDCERERERMNDSSKISLEDYHLLNEDPRRAATILRPHLNQVIEMHGFSEFYHEPKVIEFLNLAPPVRTTLHHSTSSPVPLTVGEVAADLEALGWQDFNIPSIQTLNFMDDKAIPLTAAASEQTFRAPPARFVVERRRPRTKRKLVSVNALVADDEFPKPPSSPLSPPYS